MTEARLRTLTALALWVAVAVSILPLVPYALKGVAA